MSELKPHDPETNYVMIHNAFLTLYTKLPDFKADHIAVWSYLSMRYNSAYGYAFPDTYDIAIATNIGFSKVASVKATLKKYGLIEVRRRMSGNDLYVPIAPITDEVEFYRAYPEARKRRDERWEMAEKRRNGNN